MRLLMLICRPDVLRDLGIKVSEQLQPGYLNVSKQQSLSGNVHM